MKNLYAAILLIAFGTAATAKASVIYNVDIIGNSANFGSGVVTLAGSIATDGAKGSLKPSDITGFHLSVSGPTSHTIDSANTRLTCAQAGCDLFVSGNQLIAGDMAELVAAGNHVATTSGAESFFGYGSYDNVDFASRIASWGGLITQALLFVNPGYPFPPPPYFVGIPYMITNAQSTIVVGNAVNPVPEPSAIWLFGFGMISLVGAAFARKTA